MASEVKRLKAAQENCAETQFCNDPSEGAAGRRFLVAEVNKILNNPAYSSDLTGSVGNASSANTRGKSESVGASSQCDPELQRIDAQTQQQKSRTGPGAVKSLELIMWSLSETIKVIDQFCPTDKLFTNRRDESQRVLRATKQTCDSMSTSSCVPRLP